MSTFDLLGIPKRSGADSTKSELRFVTWAGNGSTNDKIVYYATVDTNIGSAFTYRNDPVLGCSVRIEEDGLYSVQATNGGSGGNVQGVCISKNYSLNTATTGVPPASRVCMAFGQGGANEVDPSCSRVTFLKAGTVLRVHAHTTVAPASADVVEFAITKVSI